MTQPPAPEAASQLDQHLAHFQWRVLQDALAEATADYWEHRAADFAWVAGDWKPGEPDPGRIAARAIATARNCRFHAHLLRESGLDTEAQQLIATILIEHATQPDQTPGQVA